MKLEIEEGVPLPDERRVYPYQDMQVGDSFLVSGVKMQIICNANYKYGKKLDRKFIARQREDGIRVWRVV